MNSHLFTNKSRQIAFGLIMFVGAMMVANPSQAGGGGGLDLGIELREGMGTQAVYVGLAILLAVYVLIIFEWVHRTLAAAVGGIVAMLALNYYKEGDCLLYTSPSPRDATLSRMPSSA